MTGEEQRILQDIIFDHIRRIQSTKGDDYANSDRLSNFKLAGAICGLSAEQNCLSLIATKVARLGVLMKTNDPKHESIDDSIDDLISYSVLLKMIYADKRIADNTNK